MHLGLRILEEIELKFGTVDMFNTRHRIQKLVAVRKGGWGVSMVKMDQ